MLRSKFCFALVVIIALFSAFDLCGSSWASVVYDNSSSDLNRTFGINLVPIGDEIVLAGVDRTAVEFAFEFFLSSNADGDERLQLEFYANDGPLVDRTNSDGSISQVPSPGTPFYISPPLVLDTGFNTAQA